MPAILICIIGAGPAGASSAIALTREGFDVTLIEQHRFPRDKVCGECVSSLGDAVLGRLGFDLRQLGALTLRRATLHARGGTKLDIELPGPMFGISRNLLDDLLLTRARAAGVTVLQPTRCEKLTPGARPAVDLRDLSTNRLQNLTFDLILLADGKGAFLPGRPINTTDFGVKAHFTNFDGPLDTIDLFGVDGHYGGVAPVEGGLFNISFNVPKRRLAASHEGLDALFAEIIAENVSLQSKMRSAVRVSAWLTSPLPRFPVRSIWPAGVIPLGNAAAALEPIGGEGMGLALRSAELATREIIAARNESRAIDTHALQRDFSRLWAPRRAGCRLVAKLISSPRVAGRALSIANRFPSIPRMALDWLGKTST